VIIAGFGRFGQITGRILSANNITFTALDKDAEHIEFVKKFGNKVFFGDATRLDLLKTSGIEHAKVILIAIDNPDEVTKLAKLVIENYPSVTIIARARNRTHATELAQLSIDVIVREMFESGVQAAVGVLNAYGFSLAQAQNAAAIFSEHDAKILEKVMRENHDMSSLIETAKQGREELADLFKQDKQST
jgi:CPA2 family monovalent cation:H+ antiporter-2